MAPASECNATCSGNSKEVCGGADRNSVWKTRRTVTGPTPSPRPNLPNTHVLNAEDLNAAREELLRLATTTTTTTTTAAGLVTFTTNANNKTAGWLINSYKELKDSLPAVLADKTEYSVMAKNLSLPNISNHNYISIGIYDHPCNDLPHGCKPYERH